MLDKAPAMPPAKRFHTAKMSCITTNITDAVLRDLDAVGSAPTAAAFNSSGVGSDGSCDIFGSAGSWATEGTCSAGRFIPLMVGAIRTTTGWRPDVRRWKEVRQASTTSCGQAG